jgi:hypothetical protein
MLALIEAKYPDESTEIGIATCLGLCACDDLPEVHKEWLTPQSMREGRAKIEILHEITMTDDDTTDSGYKISDLVNM